MSIADPFIKRPVLTSVCSIAIFIAGLLASQTLPVEFIPDVAPSQIRISAIFPGGNASIVEKSVTDQLEDLLSDTPGVDYIVSSSTATTSTIQLFLAPETSADTAMLDAQNRIQKGQQNLPQAVIDKGVSVSQSVDTQLSGYLITSDQGQYNSSYLATLIEERLKKPLKLINGIGTVDIYPTNTLFQVSLDPDLLRAYGLTSDEVSKKIRSQNTPSSAGYVGAPFVNDDASYNYPVLIKDGGYIQTVEQFENLAVRTAPSGALIRVRDIGKVEYISDPNNSLQSLDGYPASFIAINQKSGSNAVLVATRIEELIAEFKKIAPPGVKVIQITDNKTFILDSIENVTDALGLAVILVLVTLILFLKKWRTVLIPALAIPVAIVGTFFFLKLFGFTLNFLTLTGLVLATGLVVDDGILVVESVSKNIDAGMSSREAAISTMNEISGAVVSTSLVLITLFLPVTLIASSIGKIFQQFAATIIFSIAISTFNALTFSPMMAGLILLPGNQKSASKWVTGIGGLIVGGLFGMFTRANFGDLIVPIAIAFFGVAGFYLDKVFYTFESIYIVFEEKFSWLLKKLIQRHVVVSVCLIPALIITVFFFNSTPKALIPQEDQGTLFGLMQLASGASLPEKVKVAEQAGVILKKEQLTKEAALENAAVIANADGLSVFAKLKPLKDRPKKSQGADALQQSLASKLSLLPLASPPFFVQPPMIRVAPNSSINMLLIDKSSRSYTFEDLNEFARRFKEAAQKDPLVSNIYSTFSPDSPAYELTINRSRLSSLGVDFSRAMNVLLDLAGGSVVNQTSLPGGIRDVQIISDSRGRRDIDDLLNYSIDSQDSGNMVEIKQFATAELSSSPPVIDHFGFNRSVKFQIQPAPGASQGQVINRLKEIFAEGDFKDIGYAFDGIARTQEESGGQILMLYALAGLAVFLILSATYESYITSTTILLTVPIAILGSLVFIKMRSMDINIFSQVGLLMLIGLAAKNAILVVEFADQGMANGLEAAQAAFEAAKSRLRPILMTSIASLAGFLPLVVARNAGANAQQSIGTAVFGGLVMGTILSLGVVPPVYVLVKNLEARWFKSDRTVHPEV
ncbi:MAG: RND transporter [Synechococcus sp. NP17]|nr:RND transporter [Synechococcus sp. NP17]